MSDIDDVRALGDRIGYGNLMLLAESAWRSKLEPLGFAGGEFSCGPCASEVVPCACSGRTGAAVMCDWCCGTGRVTKRVRQAALEPPPPVPQIQHPPASADSQQQGDDGEDV